MRIDANPYGELKNTARTVHWWCCQAANVQSMIQTSIDRQTKYRSLSMPNTLLPMTSDPRQDRGISHAAKGHLSPYCWMLLAIYYLQVQQKKRDRGGTSFLWRLKKVLKCVQRHGNWEPNFLVLI